MIFFGFNVHGHYSKQEWHAQTQTSCAGFTWHKLAEANKVVFRELETLSGGVMQHICFSYSPQDTLCHSLPTALGIQGKRGTAAGSRAVDLHSCKEMSRAEELNRRGQGSWERNKKRLCKGKKKKCKWRQNTDELEITGEFPLGHPVYKGFLLGKVSRNSH